MNVLIVGAGPAGSATARLLAEQGHAVSVFEEHEKIGRPIACTGLVTNVLWNFVEKDDSFITNELLGVKVTAPSGKELEIPLHEFAICRETFDAHLAKLAIEAGAQYHTRHKFTRLNNGKAVFAHAGSEHELPYDLLIGADGPFSAVGRAAGLIKDRRYYIGSQATITGDFDPAWFLTFFGNLAPGFFAWAVPENNHQARVGVASKKNVARSFELLREKFNGEIIERQAGPIPIYEGARHVQKENIFLVGDAAGVCKNTTGGGIITGIWNAHILANSLKNKRDYSSALSPLRRELWLHAKLRTMLDKFSNNDYERLVHWMSKPAVKAILFNHPREYPSKLLWKLAIAEPKLLAFTKYALA